MIQFVKLYFANFRNSHIFGIVKQGVPVLYSSPRYTAYLINDLQIVYLIFLFYFIF